MKAVILAAGDGGRLGTRTLSMPKPLVPIAGRPLVAYTLEALRESGVRDAVFVTGYRAPQVVAGVSALAPAGIRVSFVTNQRFDGGASLSLRAARFACGDEPFLLLMSDHLVSLDLVERLTAAGVSDEEGHCYVAADFSPRDPDYVEEATKLSLDDFGRVRGIGKELPSWQALDAGAFYLTKHVWAALEASPEDCELSVIFGRLADSGLLLAADIDGAFWYDVDTIEDLAGAEALLRGRALPAETGV